MVVGNGDIVGLKLDNRTLHIMLQQVIMLYKFNQIFLSLNNDILLSVGHTKVL